MEKGPYQVPHMDATGAQDHRTDTRLSTDSKQASAPTPSPWARAGCLECRISKAPERESTRRGRKGAAMNWRCQPQALGRPEAAIPGLSCPTRGAWAAQWVKHLTLGFGSGHDLTVS